jgi:hypothetical protein
LSLIPLFLPRLDPHPVKKASSSVVRAIASQNPGIIAKIVKKSNKSIFEVAYEN